MQSIKQLVQLVRRNLLQALARLPKGQWKHRLRPAFQPINRQSIITPTNSPYAAWCSLTPRERQVTVLASRGYTNGQIASRLFISVQTVKSHLRHILPKYGVHSKAELRKQLADFPWEAEWQNWLPASPAEAEDE